jgi:hypothetical protein
MRPQPADACLGMKGAELGWLGLGIFVGEGDLTIFQGEAAVLAQGHAQDVGRQRLEGLRAGAHRFTMPHPVLCPALWGDKVNHAGLSQRLAALGANPDGKGRDGDQESCAGWPPRLALLGQCPRGPQGGARGMRVHRPGPGVPPPAHPDRAADNPRLAGERVEGHGGSAEEGVVEELLVAAGQFPPRLGPGKGDQASGAR